MLKIGDILTSYSKTATRNADPSGRKVRPEARNTELEAFSNLMVGCGEINLASSGKKGENQKGAFGRDDHVAPS